MTDHAEQPPVEPDPQTGRTDQQSDAAAEIPEIADSDVPDAAPAEAFAEDDPDLLDPATRAIEGADAAEDKAPSDEQRASAAALADDSSDTEAITDEAEPAGDGKDSRWDSSTDRTAHRIGVELKHVETSVRKLLEDRDTRRKRHLGGTRRWLELEEDILSWRFAGRFAEDTLDQLSALIAKRHYLFSQLQLVSTVRPGWRTRPA